MNKTLLLASAAVCLFAVNANAADFTPYVSAKLTRSDITFDGKDTWAKGSTKHNLDDKVWGFSVAGGVSTKVAGGAIRTELEYNWNDTAEKNATLLNGNVPVKAELDTQSLFINAYYDIDTGTKFTPYVGGGIGYAKVEGTYSNPNVGSISEDDTNFAWQLGAGVAYAINENVSVDFGYRYTDMGDLSKNYVEGANYEIDVDSHELMLGARYTF